LTNIAQGEGIDQRDRRTIELMGVKLCMELTALSNNPLYVAVVHLKNTDAGLNSDFFRGASGSRGTDFDISLNSNEFHCLPLNTDKFVVLSHKRHRLKGGVPKFPGPDIKTISLAGYNYANTANYMPIKRNIKYTGGGTNTVTADSNIKLIWWCDTFGAPGNTQPQNNQLNMSQSSDSLCCIIPYYLEYH
jgi:hypothetical protein